MKLQRLFGTFIIFVLLLTSLPLPVYADNAVTMTHDPSVIFVNTKDVSFTFKTSPDNPVFTVKPQSGYNTFTLALWRPGADASNIKELTFYYQISATNSAGLGNTLETGNFEFQKKYDASTNPVACDNIFSCFATAIFVPGGLALVGYQVVRDRTGQQTIPVQMNVPGYWTVKLYRENFQPKVDDKQKDDPKTGHMFVDQQKFNTMLPLYEGGYRVYPTCDEKTGCIALRISPSQIKNGGKYDLYIINASAGKKYSVWYMKNGVPDAQVLPIGQPDMNVMKPGTFGDVDPVTNIAYPIGTFKQINPLASGVAGGNIKNNTLCVSQVDAGLSQSTNQLTCDFWINLDDVLRNAVDPSTADDVNYTIISNQPGMPTPEEPLIDESTFKQGITRPPCSSQPNAFVNGRCAKFDTAIGTIDTTPMGFIQKLFGLLLSIAGTIALIIIIYSGYQLMTSEGNPEKVQGAKDSITSAIIGLTFMIFSIVIMQFVGVNILQLPGFGK